MDRTVLRRIITELEPQVETATGVDRRNLLTAIGILRAAAGVPTPVQTRRKRGRGGRASPVNLPDDLWRQLLRSGRDPWVAAALGTSRSFVRSRRMALNIPAFPQGGDTVDRDVLHQVWLDNWRPRLQELGYLQDSA